MHQEYLSSTKNPNILLARSLKQKKGRDESGCFLVEGKKAVGDALEAGFVPEMLFALEDQLSSLPPASLPQDARLYVVPEHVLAAVCDTMTPQGICCVMRKQDTHVKGRRLVALDGVQDPGNVGTILRTSDAAALDGVLLSSACADPYAPKVVRATMGSIFHIPFQMVPSLPEALRALKEEGITLISTQLDGKPFFEAVPSLPESFCLVIGNEGQGVTEEVRAMCDIALKLPMPGRAESLNASVAAGILIYEMLFGCGRSS
ncbi:MAG: RNA methyltransferase [Clostridia bacterium]|nr:RNA methyltransferase [Clostridia bacterium]